jgi:hypothetical protein
MREQFHLHPVKQELDGEATGLRIVFDPVLHRLVRLIRDDDQVCGVAAMSFRMAR